MNIFVVDEDPHVAAKSLCDMHVVKMVLETAQLLCTAHWILDHESGHMFVAWKDPDYKPTHRNHPCSKWARKESNNYTWLAKHGLTLCEEYTERFGRNHKTEPIIRLASLHTPLRMPPSKSNKLQFPLCVPEDCVVTLEDGTPDVVESYRTYYRTHKRHIATWKQNQPDWWY